jgi:hypothetical protein
MVFGRYLDLLAWNQLATAVFKDFDTIPRHERNFLRMLFLDADVRGRFVDWNPSHERPSPSSAPPPRPNCASRTWSASSPWRTPTFAPGGQNATSTTRRSAQGPTPIL